MLAQNLIQNYTKTLMKQQNQQKCFTEKQMHCTQQKKEHQMSDNAYNTTKFMSLSSISKSNELSVINSSTLGTSEFQTFQRTLNATSKSAITHKSETLTGSQLLTPKQAASSLIKLICKQTPATFANGSIRAKQTGFNESFSKQLDLNRQKKCNLCNISANLHCTKQCRFSIDLYYPTSLEKLKGILQKGILPQKRQLGWAIYVSDEAITCIKWIHRNKQKFKEPVLLKLKANATHVKQIKSSNDVRFLNKSELAKEFIQCIKYPIYYLHGKPLYMWGMYKCNYAAIGYSQINLQKNQQNKEISTFCDVQKAQMKDQLLNPSQYWQTNCLISPQQTNIQTKSENQILEKYLSQKQQNKPRQSDSIFQTP